MPSVPNNAAKQTTPVDAHNEGKRQPQQLDLFSPERWPRRPYCSDDPSSGLQIRGFDQARSRAYIQPNHPSILWRVPFDLDRPTAAADWYDRDAPPPTAAIQNPDTGHAHVVYEIEIPVHRNGDTPAMRLAAAVEHGLGRLLEADPCYTGLLIQTPHHPSWRTSVWREVPYDLTELAEWLPEAVNAPCWRDRRRAVPEDFALGRNVALFHSLRRWAYRAVRDYWQPDGEPRWREAVESKAQALNSCFDTPLGPEEVAHTAKSVSRWVWTHMSPSGLQRLIDRTHTPELQAERGRKKGQKQREALQERAYEMHNAGHTQREIAAALGITQRTVSNWLRRPV